MTIPPPFIPPTLLQRFPHFFIRLENHHRHGSPDLSFVESIPVLHPNPLFPSPEFSGTSGCPAFPGNPRFFMLFRLSLDFHFNLFFLLAGLRGLWSGRSASPSSFGFDDKLSPTPHPRAAVQPRTDVLRAFIPFQAMIVLAPPPAAGMPLPTSAPNNVPPPALRLCGPLLLRRIRDRFFTLE